MHWVEKLDALRTLSTEVAAATAALRDMEKKLTDTRLELVAACRPAILAAVGAYNAEPGIKFMIDPSRVVITFPAKGTVVDLFVRFLDEPNEELQGWEDDRVREQLAPHVASACARLGSPFVLGTLSVPVGYFSK